MTVATVFLEPGNVSVLRTRHRSTSRAQIQVKTTMRNFVLKAPFAGMCSIIPGYRDVSLPFSKKREENGRIMEILN